MYQYQLEQWCLGNFAWELTLNHSPGTDDNYLEEDEAHPQSDEGDSYTQETNDNNLLQISL